MSDETKRPPDLELYAWWKANEARLRDQLMARYGERAIIEAVGEAFQACREAPVSPGPMPIEATWRPAVAREYETRLAAWHAWCATDAKLGEKGRG
jgi:hypothetical protein